MQKNIVNLHKIKKNRYLSLSNPTKWQLICNCAFTQGPAALTRKILIFVKLKVRFLVVKIYQLLVSSLFSRKKKECVELIAINITGGVGDVVVASRYIRDLYQQCECAIKVDLYYDRPDLIRFIVNDLDVVSKIYPARDFDFLKENYPLSLILNQFPIIAFREADAHILRMSNRLLKVVKSIEKSRIEYKSYIESHPKLDGAFSDIAVQKKFDRERSLHTLSRVVYGGTEMPISTPEVDWDILGLKPGTFITIHDGWDADFRIDNQRPTKSMQVEFWISLCEKLKQRLGDSIQIVQLGGLTGQVIPNVDVNLKGKLKLEESCEVLKRARFHIDSESGLVHLASLFGTPCVVLFGPTNYDYFSYSNNINIKPNVCGNCWWSSDSWMSHCVLNEVPPLCTSSIDPNDVVDKVVARLFSD